MEFTSSFPSVNNTAIIFSPFTIRDPMVPDTVKVLLKELMLSYPNGLSLKAFENAYAKRFHHYIHYKSWGFESLSSMISSVPDILICFNDTTRNLKIVKRVVPLTKVKAKSTKKSMQECSKQSLINGCSDNQKRKSSVEEESRTSLAGHTASKCEC